MRISALTVVLVGALVASTAAAQPGEAPAHYQRALELYQEQDFAGALVEFRRAHELAPSYKMLFNIGQVCFQLNDYACAMHSFESYLKEGGSAVSTERRAEVEKDLQKLRLRVGKLEIVTNVPGVEIVIDDVSVGKTPLAAPVIVSTGKRRVVGSHEGYAPVSRVVEVAGTDSSRIELTFANASAAAAAGQRTASRWNTVSWVGLGLTAAFAVGAGVTGAIALDAENDREKQRYADGRGPSDAMRSTSDRAATFSVLSDVGLGLSIATLAGTLIYTFVHTPKQLEAARVGFTLDGFKGSF